MSLLAGTVAAWSRKGYIAHISSDFLAMSVLPSCLSLQLLLLARLLLTVPSVLYAVLVRPRSASLPFRVFWYTGLSTSS